MTTLDDSTYRYRGLTFGKGTEYPLAAPIDGLRGFDARIGDRDVPRGHGSVPGKHYSSARLMMATFVVADGSTATVEERLEVLDETFMLAEDEQDELVWLRPGMPERMVRCRPVSLVANQDRLGTRAEPKVALRAADPRIYSAAEHAELLPLYTASGGGIDLPADLPFDFSAGSGVETVVTNAGKVDAYPTLRFYGNASGTISSVTVTNRTTGVSMTVTTNVIDGQVLTVDFTAYVTASGASVVDLDGASRYGSWDQPREPLALPPGDSILRFTTTGTNTTASGLVSWRDTWIA